MAEQLINVIYRTAEHGGTFRTSYNISFFSNVATIQGVSGTITPQCWRELICYFIMKVVKYYEYERKKNGKSVFIRRPVRGF